MSERRELSLRLNKVLEMVGLTEEMRSYHRRMARITEILQKLSIERSSNMTVNVYQCGSSYEGTVTPDLASDIDMIFCTSETLDVPHCLMPGPGVYLQAVRDDWTRPGYVKLQFMRDGKPLTVHDLDESDSVGFDGEGRACQKQLLDGTRHGPARMHFDKQGRHYGDQVDAFQCNVIPLFATDWTTRQRPFDWPSQKLIDKLKLMGCLFVSVGHYMSRDKELEWRLSFSLQERMLMESLNITQHRVYVLLKIIRKDIFDKCLKEESLTSYHCKTAVFYMLATTPETIWVPDNIIDCLLKCLSLLLQWLKAKFCPSFFLKDSNLFDKEGFSKLARSLEMYISLLLQTGQQFLYWLQSDRVGEMLKDGDLTIYKPFLDSRIDKYIFTNDIGYISNTIFKFRCLHISIPNELAHKSLAVHMINLARLQHDITFPGYTEKECRTAIQYVLPWPHLSIGLEFATRAVKSTDRHECKGLLKKVYYHLQQARNADLVNVTLAKATLSLRLGKIARCLALLQKLENKWKFCIYICCPCKEARVAVYLDEQQKCEIASKYKDITLGQSLKTLWTSCVIFDRSQIELVPSALLYEMFRSLYTRPESRDELNTAWFDRAAVDAIVYFCLLQYLVCSNLNNEPYKQIAIHNLALLTLHDRYELLYHRETAFNLLGWVYMQENRLADAEKCFLQSWKIRPHNNAAKFHMLDMCLRLKEARASKHNDAYM